MPPNCPNTYRPRPLPARQHGPQEPPRWRTRRQPPPPKRSWWSSPLHLLVVSADRIATAAPCTAWAPKEKSRRVAGHTFRLLSQPRSGRRHQLRRGAGELSKEFLQSLLCHVRGSLARAVASLPVAVSPRGPASDPAPLHRPQAGGSDSGSPGHARHATGWCKGL